MWSILCLAVPTVLAAVSIWRLQGVWRIAAVGCLIVMLPAFVRDMIGVAHGGNLAGIYTLMLMTPALLFLLTLHGTYWLTRRSDRVENITLRYAMVWFSSLLLSGVILYAWTYPIFFPLFIEVGLVAYWSVGVVLAVTAGVFSSLTRNRERPAK